jgi:putative inorganic carbon (HCO3(-)) transporter
MNPGATAYWAGRGVTPLMGADAIRPAPAPASGVAFGGLVAFTVVMLIAPQTTFPALNALRPALLAAAVAIGAYLLHRLVRREPLVRPAPELALAVLLLWWAALTLPMSMWVGGSIDLLLSLYIKTLLIFALLCHVVDTPRRLKVLAAWLTGLSVPMAYTGVTQFLSGEFLATGTRRIEGFEAALTHNPNDLALMLNLLLPLGLALMMHARTQPIRLLLAGIVLLQLAGIVLTFSRSGFVTLAVVVMLQLYRLARRGRLAVAAALVMALLLAVPLLPVGYLDRLSTIVDTNADQTGSAQARWSDMAAAAGYIARNPIIGAGLGMDILALNEVRGPLWTQVHDVYLQYGVDLGLPGLVLFTLLLASAIRSAARARSDAARKGRPDIAAVADAIWVSLVAFAVAAVFYPVGYHFYFYYFAGLAVAARHVCRDAQLPKPQLVHATPRAA